MREGGVISYRLSVVSFVPHRLQTTDYRQLFISCVQIVVRAGVRSVQNPGLYTRWLAVLRGGVQKITSYTPSMPACFRVVFHGPNSYFTPVFTIVMPIVHTTNKCDDRIFY